jgi:hypothetical protein
MDVLERIERGELYFDIGTCIGRDDKAANELLRLAKLGAAAEKAINDPRIFGAPCSNEALQFINDNCAGRCAWWDFCKLRKE